jgi:hypothetical protein
LTWDEWEGKVEGKRRVGEWWREKILGMIRRIEVELRGSENKSQEKIRRLLCIWW